MMRFDSAFADRISSVVFFVLGAAMLYGGFVMDRLEIRQIHPASIPGLVPMFLGGILMICAVLLYVGSSKSDERAEASDIAPGDSWRNLMIAGGWSVFYAAGLVGQVPFVVATAIYIAGFTLYFGWPENGGRGARIKATLFAVIFAVVVASAISALFRYGFLVRLP